MVQKLLISLPLFIILRVKVVAEIQYELVQDICASDNTHQGIQTLRAFDVHKTDASAVYVDRGFLIEALVHLNDAVQEEV